MLFNRERLVWLSVLAATATFAWQLGKRQENPTGDPARGESASSSASAAGSEPGIDSKSENRRSRTAQVPVPREGEALKKFTLRALRDSDPIRRSTAFLRILDQATPENFDQISGAWKELRFSGTYLPNEELMMNFRAGEIMGRKAMGNRKGSARDLSMMHAVTAQYRGWVAGDPADAKRWLDELPEGQYRKKMNEVYLSALAEDNAAEAIAELANLPEQDQASAAGSIIARVRQTESVDAASAMLAKQAVDQPDSPVYRGMFDTLIRGTLDDNGALAGRLIEEHAGKPYVSGHWITETAMIRGERDGKTAEVLDWALRMESAAQPGSPGEFLASTAARMTTAKLEAAGKWLEAQQQSPLLDGLRSAIERRQAELAADAEQQ